MEQQDQKDCDKTINEGLSRFLGPPIKQPTLSTSDNDIDGHFDSLTSHLQRLSKTPLIFHEPMMKAVELLTERFAQYQKWHSLRETGTNGSDCGLEEFANLTKIMLSFAVIHLLDFRKTKDLDADDNEQDIVWDVANIPSHSPRNKFFQGQWLQLFEDPVNREMFDNLSEAIDKKKYTILCTFTFDLKEDDPLYLKFKQTQLSSVIQLELDKIDAHRLVIARRTFETYKNLLGKNEFTFAVNMSVFPYMITFNRPYPKAIAKCDE